MHPLVLKRNSANIRGIRIALTFDVEEGRARHTGDLDGVLSGVLDLRIHDDELVAIFLVLELVLGRREQFLEGGKIETVRRGLFLASEIGISRETHVLPEGPFRFAVRLGEVRFEDDLLVFAFLGILIHQWFQEAFLLL